MTLLSKGRYRAVEVRDPIRFDRVMALRAAAFRADRAGGDAHDALCRHILIEEVGTGAAVATFRIATLSHGNEAGRSYSAAVYDLTPLAHLAVPMVELGRFCIHPDRHDPDILRLAWAALTRIVDEARAGMLFGCASFGGTDWTAYGEAFAFLHERHVAPSMWRPRAKAPRRLSLSEAGAGAADPRRAMATMPPLLRTYLGMGGRVSDHAVIDEEMDTIHVFTGVEVKAIPAARRRLLRANAE